MIRMICLALLALVLPAQTAHREAVYGAVATIGGQVAPLFANGYLVYVHLPNRLQVLRPDTQLAYEYDVPCPQAASHCSVGGVAVTRNGVVALGIAYTTANGYTSGIRIVDPAGKETRFFSTGRYVPVQLAFDGKGDLWSMGWERDESINDRESSTPYNIVRKYSADGTLGGEFLPRTLWPGKHGPGLTRRGYWTMYAAEDRIGAIVNENTANATPEWVEWNLNGVLLSRTPLSGKERSYSRAFSSKGRLYAQFDIEGKGNRTELRVLDVPSGKWIPAQTRIPDGMSGYLLGAEGDELVYRLAQAGNVHLVWSRPE